jgi:hypothetical protein
LLIRIIHIMRYGRNGRAAVGRLMLPDQAATELPPFLWRDGPAPRPPVFSYG